MKAKIINQPKSGEYEERIYDIKSPWNSQSWTWIKFTDKNGINKVGQFRGMPIQVKVSDLRNEIIVLTSDHIFQLDINELNIIETKRQTQYQDLEVSPKGAFIFHNYYEILKMENSLSEMTKIESPFEMDDIQFIKWNGNELIFTCEEFGNWSRLETMELNTSDWKIKVHKNTP